MLCSRKHSAYPRAREAFELVFGFTPVKGFSDLLLTRILNYRFDAPDEFGCILMTNYTSSKSNRYPRVTVDLSVDDRKKLKLPGNQETFHRILLRVRYAWDCLLDRMNVEVSHLCHEKGCGNVYHFVIESAAENTSRKPA